MPRVIPAPAPARSRVSQRRLPPGGERSSAVQAIVLGLAASLFWGVSDFIGGLQSRRSPQITVMLLGAGVAFAGLATVVVVDGTPRPGLGPLLWGVAGGAAVTVGLAAFYRGLAIGMMSVVAPVSSTGAILPVAVGIAGGERPGLLAMVGAVLAITGVVLVSRQEGDRSRRSSALVLSVVLALVAALGFGSQFVALNEAAKGD